MERKTRAIEEVRESMIRTLESLLQAMQPVFEVLLEYFRPLIELARAIQHFQECAPRPLLSEYNFHQLRPGERAVFTDRFEAEPDNRRQDILNVPRRNVLSWFSNPSEITPMIPAPIINTPRPPEDDMFEFIQDHSNLWPIRPDIRGERIISPEEMERLRRVREASGIDHIVERPLLVESNRQNTEAQELLREAVESGQIRQLFPRSEHESEPDYLDSMGSMIEMLRASNTFILPNTERHQHHLDKRFPHVCFKCKKKLKYKHALGRALHEFIMSINFDIKNNKKNNWNYYKEILKETKQFRKWWKNAIIQFYCCSCFNPIKRARERQEAMIANLDDDYNPFGWSGPGEYNNLPDDINDDYYSDGCENTSDEYWGEGE